MDTAPTTVAQDLMVLLRYGGKGTVQQLCPTEDHGYRSHYRGAGPHGRYGGKGGQYSNYALQKIMVIAPLTNLFQSFSTYVSIRKPLGS
jgi:hypothetical protein